MNIIFCAFDKEDVTPLSHKIIFHPIGIQIFTESFEIEIREKYCEFF